MIRFDDTTEGFQPQIGLEFTENEMGDVPNATRRLSTNPSRLEAIDKRYLSQSSVAFYGRNSVDSRSDKSWLHVPSQVPRHSLPPMVERNQDGTHGKKFMSASYAGPDLRGNDFRYSRRRYLRHISSENSKRVVSFLRKRLQDRDRFWLEDESHTETERPETERKSLVEDRRVKSVNLFSQYNEIGGRVSKEGHINEDLILPPTRPLHNELSLPRKSVKGASIIANRASPLNGQKVKGLGDVEYGLLKYVDDDLDDSADGTDCEASSERGPGDIQIDLLAVGDEKEKKSTAGSEASKSSRHSSSRSDKSEMKKSGKGNELIQSPLRSGKSDSGIDMIKVSPSLPKISAASDVPVRRASLPGKALSPTEKGEFKLPLILQHSEGQMSKSDEMLHHSKDREELREKQNDLEDESKISGGDGTKEKEDEVITSVEGVKSSQMGTEQSFEIESSVILPSVDMEDTEGSATLPLPTSNESEESKVKVELPDLNTERSYLVSPVLTPLPDETARLLDDNCGTNSTVLQDLLEGDIHIQVPIERKVIELYVSSHLSDMESERTLLMSKVFSKGLRQFCKEWGFELQLMDPHWGLKDTWTNDHSHVDLCIEQLQHCKAMSHGPYFMMMVGQKMGYQSLPKRLKPEEYLMIVETIKQEKEKLVATWKAKIAASEAAENSKMGGIDGDGLLSSRRMSIVSQRSQRSLGNKSGFKTGVNKMMRSLKVASVVSKGRSSVFGDIQEPKEDPEVTAQKAAEKECDDNLVAMETWYKLDENQVPPAYTLQNISFELKDFMSGDKLKKQRARNQWAVIHKQILDIIKKYLTSDTVGPERREELLETMPEKELRLALPTPLESGDSRAYAITRNIPDLRRNLQDFTAKEYIDLLQMKSEVDDACYERVQTLKYETLPKLINEKNIKDVTVRWHKDGISGQSDRTHALYLDNLAQNCLDVLKSKVQRCIEQGDGSKGIPTDDLFEEVAQHAVYAQNRCKTFFGRKDALIEIKEYLLTDSRLPLVMHGESGIGKTSLVAKSLELIRSWTKRDDACIIYRFIGITPASEEPHFLLRSLCQQICYLYELDQSTIPEDFYGVINDFEVKLSSASVDKPLVIFIDGLDELKSNGHELSWLPKTLPENVKLVLTVQSGEECNSLKLVKKQCPSVLYVPISPLSQTEISFLLNYQLTIEERTLTEAQRVVAMEMCQANPNPLFVRLVCSEAKCWRSFAERRETFLPNELRKLVNAILVQLENTHGEAIIRRALGYLTAAKWGLTWTELEDLMSLDDTVMSEVITHHATRLWHFPPGLQCRIMKDLEPWVNKVKMDGVWLYRWDHQMFRHCATERYLDARDKAPSYHLALAEYFLSRWADKRKPYPGSESGAERFVDSQQLIYDNRSSSTGQESQYNLRKLRALPFHLINSNQLPVLKKEVLFHFEWMLAKLKATSLGDVTADLHSALSIDPNDPELRLLSETLLHSAEALKHDPNQLASQLTGRLGRMILNDRPKSVGEMMKYPLLAQMVSQASSPSIPALVPSISCLAQPGGLLYDLLAGHSDVITAVCVSSDGFLAATASKDDSVKLWDLKSRRVLKTIPGTGKNVTGIHLYLDSDLVAVVQSNVISVYSFQDLTLLAKMEDYIDPAVVSSAGIDHQYLVAFFSGSNVIRAWDLSRGIALVFEREFVQDGVHKDSSLCMSLQSNGEKVLYAFRSDDRAYVINVTNGKRVYELQPPKDGASVTALGVSRDFYIVACRYVYMTLSEIHKLELFDIQSGHYSRSVKGCTHDIVKELYVNKNSTHALCICPSRQTNSSEIVVWNLDTDEHKHMAKHPQLSTMAACKDLNFFLTASGSDRALRIWNIKKHINERDPSDSSRMSSQRGICQLIPMSNNPRYVVAKTHNNGPLSVWNVVKGKCAGSAVRIERGLTNLYDVVLVRDDKVVILSDRGEATDDVVAVYQTVLLYSLKTKKFIRKLSDTFIVPSPAHEYHLLDGDLLMGLSESRDHLIVWGLDNGQIKFRIKRSQDSKGWRAPREDEDEVRRRLQRKGTAQMTPWDRRSESLEERKKRKEGEAERERKKLEENRLEKENPIEQYCLSRDEKIVVCSYFAHHFNVFEVSTQTHLHTLEMEDSMMYLYKSAMTSAGSFLVHANYNDVEKTSYITVWDLRRGSLKKRLKNEPNVCCVGMNETADRVVFGNDKNVLKVWDIRRKQSSLRKLKTKSKSFMLGSDSKIFMMGGGEKALIFANDLLLWNLDDGTHLATFTPDLKISCVELVLDSQLIVIALNDSSDVITLRLKGQGIKPLSFDATSDGKGVELFGETTGDSTDEENENEEMEKEADES